MPRKPQRNIRQDSAMRELSKQLFQELAEEVIKEAEKLLPRDSRQRLADAVIIESSADGFTLEFDKTFDEVFLPEKYEGESVFRTRGINPNTGTPYGYAADTRRHTRKTASGVIPVKAHTKYYKVGYKPVKGKKDWYTASSKNNFGLRMAEFKIRRNFLQKAWDKVYRQLPAQARQDIPKVIEIKE
jgi:hypothetical protein|tara:strand:+ start:89 stop:646 length:558 start_codon:yes stop_codon:yes gene_type:complete